MNAENQYNSKGFTYLHIKGTITAPELPECLVCSHHFSLFTKGNHVTLLPSACVQFKFSMLQTRGVVE